jgi:EAL domain-containing protein (putative c-di-GMP-specific phosphodiesterase class I)
MPDQFIPLAESTGLIIQIGEWVLNMACLQIKQCHNLGYVDLRVAVNLSTRQFNDPELQKMIRQILNLSHILPASLILEITESVLMKDIDANSAVLQSLSDMGVTLASDDFGTGYSSLSYLRQLPFDALKIDKSFIHEMEIIHQKEAIVSSIISLGKNLNLKVIAEGVETRAQLDILKKYHCDFMQGYLFSKPITADAFIKLLQGESKK